ncbi:GNAT family N-acetyltransferase [Natronosalvus rutilus]|uniref:GNAT family N-acetyltransferase n=1 Tax=Natronosalvus rutilus TaxID=2953753 RepID=A0A9E7SVB0_9EURY|nr:GNAT family protein [Natronosalvus rutilus]UTF53742.1 GNAT family N-acetyltransferase [Natronosalvus rutilus]
MPGAVFLEGERVELRTVELEDAEFLQELINDPVVRTSLFAHRPIAGHQEQEWIESIGEDDAVKLLICVDGEAVGIVTLEPPNDVWGCAEIAYMVAPAEWGNGHATDAVEALCGYAFTERRLNKVYASVYATNGASARVLEKAGFQKEGEFRREAFVEGEYVDLLRYGLLAEEWTDGR